MCVCVACAVCYCVGFHQISCPWLPALRQPGGWWAAGCRHHKAAAADSHTQCTHNTQTEFAAEPLPAGVNPAPPAADPVGAFGQTLPQNRPAAPGSDGARGGRLAGMGRHKESGIIDADGLPHPGAIVWPKQVRLCGALSLCSLGRSSDCWATVESADGVIKQLLHKAGNKILLRGVVT